MNIKDVEAATGIAKQNIRYYEKEGLLNPKRNPENDYREYEKADIDILKKIRVLRKVGMPIEDIKKVLEGTLDLKTAAHHQMGQIQKEKQDLEAALTICKELEPKTIQSLDADLYLNRMEEEEANGKKFFSIVEDYKKVAKAEGEKSFMFMPETMIQNPREFTDELLSYANQNHYDITITKESMYPEFTLNGIEYTAHREHHRYGATVHCEAVHPELLEPQDVKSSHKKFFKWLVSLMPFFGFLFYLLLVTGGLSGDEYSIELFGVILLVAIAYSAGMGVYFKVKG